MNGDSGVYLAGATTAPVLKNNRIYSNPQGIFCAAGANPVVGGSLANANSIYDNADHGLSTTTPVTINARYNWWGDDTGPSNASANPAGQGNSVSDFVDFDHYLGIPSWVVAPHITVTPRFKDFGTILAGQTSASQAFTVLNNGSVDLHLGSVTLVGSGATAFQIASHCANPLVPFRTCAIEVEFAPASGGTWQADLAIPSDDPDAAQMLVPVTGLVELARGDVTGDNEVSLADAIKALQIVGNINTADIQYQPATSGADVNGDSRISLEEAIYILQVVVDHR